jgi:hypothetical protein
MFLTEWADIAVEFGWTAEDIFDMPRGIKTGLAGSKLSLSARSAPITRLRKAAASMTASRAPHGSIHIWRKRNNGQLGERKHPCS